MKLGYVILHVLHVGAAVAFYERAFGLNRRLVHDSSDYARPSPAGIDGIDLYLWADRVVELTGQDPTGRKDSFSVEFGVVAVSPSQAGRA